jgi:hypothetical protein
MNIIMLNKNIFEHYLYTKIHKRRKIRNRGLKVISRRHTQINKL